MNITRQKHPKDVARPQQASARRSHADLEGMNRLYEVGTQCLRAGNGFKEALDSILDTAIFLTEADKGNIQLLDADSGILRIVAQKGFEEPFLRFFFAVNDDLGTCGSSRRAAKRIIAEDVMKSEIFAGKPALGVLLEEGVRAVQSTPLASSAGKVVGIISTHFSKPHRPTDRQLALMDLLARQAADYLERKQAEEALKAASAQLQRFLDAAPTGLTRCSRDLRYLAANPAYAAMTGLRVDQIVGRPIVEVMGMEGWERIRPNVEKVLRGERVEYETILPFAAAGDRHIHVVYTPEVNRQGEVLGWVASVTDVTAFKRTQAQLQKAERLAAAGRLAASLAHEINNPLSVVSNSLYLLEHHYRLDADAKEVASTASRELARLSRIVKQSLSYYRATTEKKDVDLAPIVEESLQIFKERLDRAGIQVTRKIRAGSVMLGFGDEIRQVVDNLLLNALEVTPDGGRVAVSLRMSRHWGNELEHGVRLTIGDTGPGIPCEYRSQIFEPFFTTKPEKGTGLGLWIVQQIVSRHGGSIRIRSNPTTGKNGTVISILLPSRNHS